MSVRGYSHGDSVLLFVLWDLGSMRECKCASATLPVVSPSAWCLSIITDGHASSDWSLGPMLMCVHLGDVCIMIGSSLMFLVFFVYVLIRKSWSYLFYHNRTWCWSIYSRQQNHSDV